MGEIDVTALAAVVQDLDKRITQLTQLVPEAMADLTERVELVHRELDATQDTIGQLANGEDPKALPLARRAADILWTCDGCGAKLGLVDPEENTVRVKRSDLFVEMKAGPGGYVKTTCRTCGRTNRLDDTPDGV